MKLKELLKKDKYFYFIKLYTVWDVVIQCQKE